MYARCYERRWLRSLFDFPVFGFRRSISRRLVAVVDAAVCFSLAIYLMHREAFSGWLRAFDANEENEKKKVHGKWEKSIVCLTLLEPFGLMAFNDDNNNMPETNYAVARPNVKNDDVHFEPSRS